MKLHHFRSNRCHKVMHVMVINNISNDKIVQAEIPLEANMKVVNKIILC